MTPDVDPELRPGLSTLAAASAVVGLAFGLAWVAVFVILHALGL